LNRYVVGWHWLYVASSAVDGKENEKGKDNLLFPCTIIGIAGSIVELKWL
jgi:hypothetical protein